MAPAKSTQSDIQTVAHDYGIYSVGQYSNLEDGTMSDVSQFLRNYIDVLKTLRYYTQLPMLHSVMSRNIFGNKNRTCTNFGHDRWRDVAGHGNKSCNVPGQSLNI